MEKRPALGKGLSALIPDFPEPRSSATVETDIDRLAPNEFPAARARRRGEAAGAGAVDQNERRHPADRRAQDGRSVSDHRRRRRWRAAKLAGLLRVPIAVRDVAPGQEQSLLQMALIENIQRENLNPIEEALAYRRLADEFHLRQEDIAAAVGKDRASVANFLRLLKLPDEIRTEVATGRLSMGHARALLALTDESQQRSTARDVIARSLSVRETESLVKRMAESGAPREALAPAPVDVHTRAAEEKLKFLLGTRVRIVRRGSGGRIEIDFTSEQELIRIYDQLERR